jgi:hypothetical protein
MFIGKVRATRCSKPRQSDFDTVSPRVGVLFNADVRRRLAYESHISYEIFRKNIHPSEHSFFQIKMQFPEHIIERCTWQKKSTPAHQQFLQIKVSTFIRLLLQ